MGFVVKAVKSVVKAVVKVVKIAAFGLIGLLIPKGNAKNKVTESRLNKRLEPEDFRKIVFGETAGASDLRYWEAYNTNKYDEVIVVAGHQIEAFGSRYIEEELVPFTSNNATGTYAGVLSRLTRLGTNPQTAHVVGAGVAWDSNSKLTGLPYYVNKWTIDEKKLPGGIPSRYTQIIKGALVYDPRRDSTRGGSGTHRANDQSTWSYSTLDGNSQPLGRNNALQMLWYLIGWRINGKLIAGRGVDLDDINFADFIAAANDVEALGYYTDMILSTGDDHEQNESIISADGLIGELLDPGGRWTYKIVKNDTADIAVDLGEDDVLPGEISWVPHARLSEKFNEVAGTFIDPSSTSLYQDRAYPTVTDAAYVTADGYRKRITHNFQSVQDVSLAQKLARIKLNKNRFTGEFTAPFNLRGLKAEIWSIVRLTIPRYGFNNKLFRVTGQSVSEQGVDLVLREEHASIYAAGTVTVPSAPSSSPSPYDIRQTVALTSLTLTAAGLTGLNGSIQPGLRLSWAAVPSIVRRIEVEYKPTAVSNWAAAGIIGPDLTSVDVGGLLSATGYDFRARTWTIHEVPNAWQTVSATSPTGKVGWAEVSATSGAPETGATRNVNRGAWAQPVAYVVGDFVQSGGSSYSCLIAHTSAAGTIPPHSNWSLLAQTGPTGASAFTLYNIRNTTLTANSVTGTGAGYSNVGGTLEGSPTASVSATMPQTAFVGLTRDPGSNTTNPNSYFLSDYCLHNSGDGNWYMVVSGTFTAIGMSSGTGTGALWCDNINVYYAWPGGVGFVPLTTPADTKLYGIFMPSSGGVISGITFSTAGQAGITPIVATALPNTIQVAATAAGTPKAAIPGFQITAKQGVTDVSATATYGTITYSNMSGATVDSDGTVSGTLVMTANSGWIQVPVTFAGQTVNVRVDYLKLLDAAGWSQQTDTSIGNPSSTSYVGSNGGPFTVGVGPSGNITFSASITYNVLSSGSGAMAGKFRYRTTPGSGSWIDVAAETVGGVAIYLDDPAQLDMSESMAAPSSTLNYEFDLVLRRSAGTVYPNIIAGSFVVAP